MQNRCLSHFALVAMTLFLGGCGTAANKQAAEATAAKLYDARAEKNWDAVLEFYSPEFYQKTSREQWRAMLVGMQEKLGDYKDRQLKGWRTGSFAGVGGSQQTTVLTYQVQYANGEATETLTFMGRGGEETLKVTGHRIDAPALLMPTEPRKTPDAAGEDESIADLTEAIRLKPDFAKAYAHRGLAYGKKGEYDKAVADFTEAIRLKPDFAEAYRNRGLAYGKKGEHDKAVADFTEAIRLKPDFAEAYRNRGNAHGRNGEQDEAIADFTEAIRLDPKDADAYYNRGNTYEQKGVADKAVADFTEAIRLKPDFAEAYYDRGVTYGRKGEHDKAIADLTEAVRLKPDFAEAYRNRGVAYGMKGDKAKAEADFARAKELGFRP